MEIRVTVMTSGYLDTVLMAAARSGNADVIQEILKYHPDVNKKDRAGRTALQFFVAEGKKPSSIDETIRALVEAGADVNARDNEGKTPIFSTCRNIKALKPFDGRRRGYKRPGSLRRNIHHAVLRSERDHGPH